MPFKSVEEVDRKINELEKQVDSGKLKLVDEKKYLAEISQLKRARRSFGDVQSQQSLIDAEKEKVGELRKQIDDPESKSLSTQYDTIREQLDAFRKEQDVAYKGRKDLFAERDGYQTKSREWYTKIKTTKDEYYQGKKKAVEYEREQKNKRYEAQKAEREKYESEKRKAAAESRLEEAREPAFASEITICQNVNPVSYRGEAC